MLAWLGVRVAKDEQAVVRHQFRELLIGKLEDTDRLIVKYFERREREFLVQTGFPSLQTAELRNWVRTQPRVSQLFVLQEDGQLIHPPLAAPRNQNEEEFLRRATPFLIDGDLVRASQLPDAIVSANTQNAYRTRGTASASTSRSCGWYVWYWGRGLNLIFWRRLESGEIVGIELDRARWMADLITELPDTIATDETPPDASQIRLVDSSADVVYQWGNLETSDRSQAVVEIPLSAPLSAWRLQYFVDQEEFVPTGRSAYFNLISAFTVASLGLAALVVYFYRESSREMREANTRVSFVNQVSHELKTPLTNIRMYADLLENDLDAIGATEGAQPRERLQVIISESGRLSRLIGNVLSFAKLQRGEETPQHQVAIVDDILRAVIERSKPAFEKQGIQVLFEGNAKANVSLDADALEQIVTNLLSNVEKYAASGRIVEIESKQQADRTTIVVSDAGPGIASEHREKVFEPFFRAASGLEDATGTGIGLAIVQNLARRHGGDARLVDSKQGARFEIELTTPQIQEG